MGRATQLSVALTTRGILEVSDRSTLLTAADTCRAEHPPVPHGQPPGVFVTAPVPVADLAAQFAVERLISCGRHPLDSLPGMSAQLGSSSAQLSPWPPWPVEEDAGEDPGGGAGDREPRHPVPGADDTSATAQP